MSKKSRTQPNADDRRRRDAILELAVAKDVPDREALEEAIARHPDLARELSTAAEDLALLARDDDGQEDAVPEGPPHPSVVNAMRRFEERMAELAGKKVSAEAAVNPFEALDRDALRGLGKTLGATTGFVLKLRDRKIRPETIPEAFVRRLSEAMSVAVETLREHFAGSPAVAAGAFFKSERRPEAKQERFEEAVRGMGLSEAEVKALLG